jgi:hypothetical protein
LLFLRAYPDDETVLDLACKECADFGKRVKHLRRKEPEEYEELDDSGIAFTKVSYSYEYSFVRWLVKWYGDALKIVWDEYEDTERLEALLPLLAGGAEGDGLDLAEISTEDWMRLAKGAKSKSDLRWLVESLHGLRLPESVKSLFYDGLELPVSWELGDSIASRTHARVDFDWPFYHQAPLRRKIKNFRGEVVRKLPEIEPADPKTARTLIKTVRSALAVRQRSLYPVEHANPKEVLVAECGRGYQLVMVGTLPENRLPIESDYGALILKNGFVIGYGVGAILFEQVEIAVNIFDTWRGGEAAHIFAQFARAFHNHFGCTRIKIERYQVGHENEEGLQSGSFWFYYKLGFVPEKPAVQRLAERELRKIQKNPAYRSNIATLRKLAESDLYYRLHGDSSKIPEDFPLAELSLKATKLIAERFDGHRRTALKSCSREAARILGCGRWTAWAPFEKEWFRRLSPLVVQIPGLKDWKKDEKRALMTILRAKGAKGETEYVRGVLKHKKLKRALLRLANN